MLLHTFFTPSLAINTYLIADPRTRQALLIDPTRDILPYIEYCKKENIHITDIAETHVHADFVSGSVELKQALKGFPKIHCSAIGGPEWTPVYADRLVKNGDTIEFNSLRFEAMATPGHTPEHIIWLCFDKTRSLKCPCLAFTGDFIFVGSVGRPDLLGKSELEKLSKKLYESLFTQMTSVPDFLEIYPAHGAGSLCGKGLGSRPTSTLGYEKLFNPAFQKKSFEEWFKELTMEMPGIPPNFIRIKKINIQGPNQINQNFPLNPFVYIDIRTPDNFAKCHLKNSINIPFGSAFCNWVGSVLFEDVCIGLIADQSQNLDLAHAIKSLKLIGFDHIGLSLLWDKDELMKQFDLDYLETIEVEKLFHQMQSKAAEVCIIDVRTVAEWNRGHIKGAVHIELTDLESNPDIVSNFKPIYTICGSGYRSSIAASFFKRKGFSSVWNVKGGMNAWNYARLPTQTLHHKV